MIKRIVAQNKKITDIASEWDSVAYKRKMAISSGADRSFQNILLPEILLKIRGFSKQSNLSVVDCGCGSGDLTFAINEYCDHIVGIDISKVSIELAMKYNNSPKIKYYNKSIQEYSNISRAKADICILNMVLSNVVDCVQILDAVNRVLKVGGRVLITIPHPCYWPQYRYYDKEEWFEYKREICMNADFTITGIGKIGNITHIHRPIENYIQELIISGFSITGFEELYSEKSRGMDNFRYPRFVYIEAEKTSS